MDFRVLQNVRREKKILRMDSEKFKAELRANKEQQQPKLGLLCSKDDILFVGEREMYSTGRMAAGD